MTKTELNAFRRALLNRQEELGNGYGGREAFAVETSADELDRIQHATARDYAMGTLERASNQLREVRSALDRVRAGQFGICLNCGAIINANRLAAMPWASFCIVCQQTADNADREIGTPVLMAA